MAYRIAPIAETGCPAHRAQAQLIKRSRGQARHDDLARLRRSRRISQRQAIVGAALDLALVIGVARNRFLR
jgi:fatty acid-binding protein DegV